MEKDSRSFMGGLPRWEYILHLFVNGFHFASLAVWIIIKVRLTTDGLILAENFPPSPALEQLLWLVKNLLPGAVLLGVVHFLLLFPPVINRLEQFRSKLA